MRNKLISIGIIIFTTAVISWVGYTGIPMSYHMFEVAEEFWSESEEPKCQKF